MPDTNLDYLDLPPMLAEDRHPWSPGNKLILAFIIGLLLLSPAILGIHWERILP